jgi:hypothetical protein
MQLRFHAAAREADEPDGPTEIGVGGARGPGKSHGVFAQLTLDDCQRCDNLSALYLRKVGKKAREQFDHLRRSVLFATEHDYKASAGLVVFPNGSRVIVGHSKSESDIDDYLGMEYDVILVEEATTLSATKFQALRDSNRTAKLNWRPRIYATTNPGGIGHNWYKKRFIDPWRRGEETDTRFIFGTVEDNAFIDDGYRKNLEMNTGWRLRAYRYGDWDIAAGQFFTTFRHDMHVIEPFSLPYGWRYWCAMDYGFTHYTTVYLFAQDGDGRVYVADEHAERRWLVPRHSTAIKAMLERNGLSLDRLDTFVAGPDVWARRGTELTIAERYAQEGIHLTPAKVDRVNGAATCLDRLGDVDAGIQPTMWIFDRCARLTECIPTLQHDPNRPEDVLKVDVDDDGEGGDDPYDGWRYGTMEAGGPTLTVGHSPTADYRG